MSMAIYLFNAAFIIGAVLVARGRSRAARVQVVLDWKRDAAIVLMCLLTVQASMSLHARKELGFQGVELASAESTQTDGIFVLDRWAAGGWNTALKDHGKAFKNTATYLVPISLLFFPGGFRRRIALVVVYSQGYVLTESITGIFKGLTERRRPFSYIDAGALERLEPDSREELLEDVLHYDVTNSFFSGDASLMVFGLTFFALALTMTSGAAGATFGARRFVWVWATTCALLGGSLRVLSGKHFPTDVLVGALFGAAIAVVLVWAHRRSADSAPRRSLPHGDHVPLAGRRAP